MYSFNKTINVYNILNNQNDDYITKKYTFNNVEYMIIKYNKEKLKSYESTDIEKFQEISKYRSVIVRDNKVVAYSPEKSINYNIFKNINHNTSNCYVEDFVDGTMINVFFDVVNETWEIATRSSVGGNIVFFNDTKNFKYFDNNYENNNYNNDYYNSTFRSMFFEACNINNFNLNSLDRRYSYTFVLQHPFNRIVTPSAIPLIYLVKVYEIKNNLNDLTKDIIINELNLPNFINTPSYIFLNTNVKFVNTYNITNYEDVENYYNGENIPYYCVGCMIYNIDGTRTKIRNNNYEIVRKLRGNQPKLQYNYLCLKQENKVKEFLKYYPEHNVIFNKFKQLTYNYTNELFINYISCFIRKEKHLKEYEFQYKNHMYKLHEKFKNELKPSGKTIDKKIVIDYVNSLHPAQQMFIINYNNYNNYNNKNNNDDNNEDNNEELIISENPENPNNSPVSMGEIEMEVSIS
tara:strand:- start:2853 stop:4238 length:1386 start_codon:yes stop_codon:yes gene_type:complete